MSEREMKVKAIKEFDNRGDLYQVVDFLNKSLKDLNIIFGIRKNGDKMTLTIYDAE